MDSRVDFWFHVYHGFWRFHEFWALFDFTGIMDFTNFKDSMNLSTFWIKMAIMNFMDFLEISWNSGLILDFFHVMDVLDFSAL